MWLYDTIFTVDTTFVFCMWRYLYKLYPSPSHLIWISKSSMHNKLTVIHSIQYMTTHMTQDSQALPPSPQWWICIYTLSSSKRLAVPLKLSHSLFSLAGYRCIDCGCGPSRGLHRHFFGPSAPKINEWNLKMMGLGRCVKVGVTFSSSSRSSSRVNSHDMHIWPQNSYEEKTWKARVKPL